MKKILFIIFLSATIIVSCKKPNTEQSLNCAAVDCLIAAPFFVIQFYDKTSGVNLIPAVIDTSKVKAWNQSNDTLYNYARIFSHVDSLKNNLTYMDFTSAKVQAKTMFVKIKEDLTIQINYNYQFKSSGCCGVGSVNDLNVQGHEFSVLPFHNLPLNAKIIRIKI